MLSRMVVAPCCVQAPLLLPPARTLTRSGVVLVELPAGFDAEGTGDSNWACYPAAYYAVVDCCCNIPVLIFELSLNVRCLCAAVGLADPDVERADHLMNLVVCSM
jgi:hypothetical protein